MLKTANNSATKCVWIEGDRVPRNVLVVPLGLKKPLVQGWRWHGCLNLAEILHGPF
ncbi:hypothetical protein F511_41290 [Dorcoceras hygrometricum]|uniref:Uncharacterized protein n=1 Tax=Dorcoceras hygrometricum TaxID=472368 RepID=A0A2Z7B751_9LAMI|nr:hypothetical protein F511_41290 [Dorcoceras hygrometricum]